MATLSELQGRVNALWKSLGVTVLGVQLLENPENFVIAAVLKWITDTALDVAGQIGLLANEMWLLFASIVIDAAEAGLGATGRSIATLVIDLLESIGGVINGFILSAGPLAPFVALIVYGGLLIGAVLAAWWLVRRIKGVALGTIT